MLIICPNCATSYDVEVASLRPNGRQVRCVRCRTVWHAELSHADKLMAAADALAPVRRAVEAVAEAVAGEPEREPQAGQFDVAASDQAEPAAAEMAFEAPADRSLSEPIAGADSDTEPNHSLAMDSPPIVPADLDADRLPIGADDDETSGGIEPFEDAEITAAPRFQRPSKHKRWVWPLSRLQSGILALIIVDAIVIGWRSDFVRALPQTASFYALIGLPVNLRGLDFDNLATATEQHEGVPILVVEGNIVNSGRKLADVPRLRFSVRNAARQEIYSWTAVAPRPLLASGEALAFRTRLASPPPDAHDVLIRFVTRYDILSGTH
jgi:predicted Zn finger-like uncharacterized protein